MIDREVNRKESSGETDYMGKRARLNGHSGDGLWKMEIKEQSY